MKLIVLLLLGATFCTEGYLKRSYVKNISNQPVRVCVYNVGGDEVENNISPAWQLCPMKKRFCF